MEPHDSIVDMLDKNSAAVRAENSEGEEISVPRKCSYCKCNVICSVLPTFIGISRIGIIVGVEECPFYIPAKTNQTKEQQE